MPLAANCAWDELGVQARSDHRRGHEPSRYVRKRKPVGNMSNHSACLPQSHLLFSSPCSWKGSHLSALLIKSIAGIIVRQPLTMPSPWRPVMAAALLLPAASAFVASGSSALSVRRSAASMPPVRRLRSATAVSMRFPAFLPAPEMSDIEDEKCVAMACTLQRLPVSMPDFAASPVATSCAKTSPAAPADGAAPLVLLHGFDRCGFVQEKVKSKTCCRTDSVCETAHALSGDV